MGKVLYVWIDKEGCRLYQSRPDVWRLFHLADREKLGEFNGWSLDYWRDKGVIEGVRR